MDMSREKVEPGRFMTIIIVSTIDSRTWLTHPPTDNNIIHPRTQDSADGYNRYFELRTLGLGQWGQ
jgi:hypothetical protein